MNYLSINEAGHYLGYDIQGSVDDNLDYVPVTGETFANEWATGRLKLSECVGVNTGLDGSRGLDEGN